MNIVDFIIIMVAIGAVGRGFRVGLFRQFLAAAGFFGGLFAGSLFAPQVAAMVTDGASKAIVTIMITLGLGLAASAIGEYIGGHLHDLADKLHLGSFNAVLGAVFEVGVVLVSAWLLAASVSNLPYYRLGRAIQRSSIIALLNRNLPPAPGVIARLEHIISPNGFPKVFVANEPAPTIVGPLATADVRAALERDAASTVKVEGAGCGGIVVGSGFVAGSGVVVTNAHVVAGVRRPNVIDANGRHAATPIWFDPNLDVAILRVSNLAGAPLPLVGDIQSAGVPGAVLGYPGGGGLVASGSHVLSEMTARGRDIYGSGLTRREIYELQTVVEPGNSGGPAVLTDGRVIGVVFAKSVQDDNIGYALTIRQVAPVIDQAEARNQPVGTGSCAEG